MDTNITSSSAAARSTSSDPSRHYLVYCDESGVDGKRLQGFGTLWITYERRGDFQKLWKELHENFFPPSEVKWQKVKKNTYDFYEALVDEFFKRNWLMFHALIISKEEVDLSLHENDWDLARRKHFTRLLANKIKRFARPGKQYRIRVDPIASRYEKADEAAEKILRSMIKQDSSLANHNIVHSLTTVDSKTSPGIQLSDLLLGAVMAARHKEVTAEPKLKLIQRIASHLGWDDLESDTMPAAQKFNVWRFWDPKSGKPRPEVTRRKTSTP